MNNIERYLFVLTIIVITLISIKAKINYKREVQILQENNKTNISNIREINYNTLSSEAFELNSEGLIFNMDYDTISLLNLSTNPKLILYNNDYSCGLCVDSLLADVADCFTSKTKKFAILSTPRTYRDILAQVINLQYSYDVFSLISEFSIPLCEKNLPFLFVLDDDLCAKCIFIPDRGEPELTKQYLNIISQRLVNLTVN